MRALRVLARMGVAVRAILVGSIILPAAAAEDMRVRREVLVRDGNNAAAAVFRLGAEKGEGSITVQMDDGTKQAFRVRGDVDRFRKKIQENGQSVNREVVLPDAVIDFGGLARYYSRPRIQRYTAEQQADLEKRWEALPAASQRLIRFEVRQESGTVAFYLDGQYVGRRKTKGRLSGLSLLLPKEGEARLVESFACERDPRFLPLKTKDIARPGAMRQAVVAVKPECACPSGAVNGIPMAVGGGDANVDVGAVKQMKGSWALEADEHLSRTALDGMPETAHFAVSRAWYTRAWALCAVDDEPGREPIVTARLTRFATSGRGDAISDTTLCLPRGKESSGKGVTPVGTVRYEKAGATIETPLYLVEFELKPGEILDLLQMEKDPQASMTSEPYLDFEFLGKLGQASATFDSRHKPDNTSVSAVHVFGVTLETSPVELRLTNSVPGNIFHNDEKPEMTAVLTATRAEPVTLELRVSDASGKTLRKSSRTFRFETVGEEKRERIDLDQDEPGWYGVEFVLRDKKGRELLRHQASCALLGPDTRKAGYESPYGTWWFGGAHYGAADKEIAGPMLFKAGLRKTTFGWSPYAEKDMEPWKITLNQIGWGLAPRDESQVAEAEKKIREQLERFPHCTWADVFHESYRYYVPDELRDVKQVDSEELRAAGKARAELAAFVARFYREKFPRVKLLVGNSSASASIIASLFRYGLDPKCVDAIGVEAVGQTCMPEKLWEGGSQGIWLAREAPRKFGHELPVTGCYEFTARTDRNLGLQRQAEWIVRDMLLCHAYRFQHINPAILHDVGNAYFNTIYGAGGLCRRHPLLYPKPAYVGVATLTKALDQVTLLRRMETGSTTVFALEFSRADGCFVYPVWTTCGEAELKLAYPKGAAFKRVDFYGSEKRIKGKETVCGTSPSYLVGTGPLEAVTLVRRIYEPPPASFKVVNRMDNAAEWALSDGDAGLNSLEAKELPLRVPGKFTLAQVKDEERGRCLELTLNRSGTLPDIVSEYTALRLKNPLPVKQAGDAIGLWVKGDSGWGKIIFELEDAQGAQWRTEGVWHDWPGDLAVCHDGWRFMGYPIDGLSRARNLSPGSRWNSTSAKHGKVPQFPVKIAGLTVVMNRRALDLTDMKDVAGVLRFRDIGICTVRD